MEAAHREGALRFGYLIMVKLHGVDDTTAKVVILRVWTEHGRKQDPCPDTLRMRILHSGKRICEEDLSNATVTGFTGGDAAGRSTLKP
jgi:hypothetical protein